MLNVASLLDPESLHPWNISWHGFFSPCSIQKIHRLIHGGCFQLARHVSFHLSPRGMESHPWHSDNFGKLPGTLKQKKTPKAPRKNGMAKEFGARLYRPNFRGYVVSFGEERYTPRKTKGTLHLNILSRKVPSGSFHLSSPPISWVKSRIRVFRGRNCPAATSFFVTKSRVVATLIFVCSPGSLGKWFSLDERSF